MEPTVGRVVYYKSRGSKDGAYESVDRAAVVTIVNSPTNVGLCVLNPEGLYFQPAVEQGSDAGNWDWMPFQKGQAAKTEELQKKLDERS